MRDSLYRRNLQLRPVGLDGSTSLVFHSASMAPTKDWPHAPVHRLDTCGVYMVTGATLHKAHLFSDDEKLSLLEHDLLTLAKKYHWQLEAWAVFVNHYHFVARGHLDALPLDSFLKQLHSDTARKLNRLENSSGREVWYNFWDTKLTYERSYLARLNYVHQNPVRHRLVNVANRSEEAHV